MIARWTWKSFSLVLSVLAAVAACSNQKTASPAKTCLLNSDCTNPLSCTFGFCHQACSVNGDCPDDKTCETQAATATSIAINVCVAEMCAFNSDCKAPQVCGRDLRCRQECVTGRDCPNLTYQCVVGGVNGEMVCAEPKIIPTLAAAAAAASGMGGSPANGGGAGGAGGSGGGVGGAPASTVPETEPNNDRGSASPYTVGTDVSATSMTGDVDFFAVTAPADLSGGYFQGSITSVGVTGGVHVVVYTAADNASIVSADGAATGESTFFFWATRPGQTYHVSVYQAGVSSAPFPYTLKITYNQVPDSYEPNDTRETAKPITVGVPVDAYFFSGYAAPAALAADQDWYLVTLAAGTGTVTVQNVATDERLGYSLYDMATFTSMTGTSSASANLGGGISSSFTIKTPGPYLLAIQPFSFNVNLIHGGGAAVPDSFTRPYRLTVAQP